MTIIRTTKVLRPRDPNDFYQTPPELVHAALDLIPFTTEEAKSKLLIHDPGSGTGVWGKDARKRFPNSKIIGYEPFVKGRKPAAYDKVYVHDYLDVLPSGVDLVMGNPPYKLAEKFIRQGYASLKRHGYMLLLLRLAFLESKVRGKGLWQEIPPTQVHVLVQRPSFTQNGKTDETAYAVYLWSVYETEEIQRSIVPTVHWLSWR